MKKRFCLLLGLIAALAASLLLLVACGGGSVSLETPQNIRYDCDKSIITWNTVENADRYSVSINGANATETQSASIPYSNPTMKEFTVSVKAVSTLIGKKTVSSEAAEATFTPLPVVEELYISETGAVSWEAVEGATGYLFRVKPAGSPSVEYEIADTQYSAFTEEGALEVSVKPVVSGNTSYFSKYAKTKTLNILKAVKPADIRYENNQILWSGVAGASKYEVTINGDKFDSTKTSYEYAANATSFTVSVKPIGDHQTTFDAKVSDEKSFRWLSAVENLTVVDGNLKWDDVTGADSYRVKLSTSSRETTVNEPVYENLPAGQSVRVQIMAQNSAGNTDTVTWFSSWSTETTVQLLAAPTVNWVEGLALDGASANAISWDGVSSAEGYNVKLITPEDQEGVISTLGSETRNFGNAFASTGTYFVSVQATASGSSSNVYSSQYSDPIKIVRLPAPALSTGNAITSDDTSLAKGFTVSFQSVSGASGYLLSRSGTQEAQKVNSTATQFRVTDIVDTSVIEEQTFNYALRSEGAGILRKEGNSRTVTLSSLSETATSFQITVLAAPSDTDIDGTLYSYTSVSKATGYVIDVGGTSYPEGTTSYDLATVLKSGNQYNVSVCSKGNGSTVLPSNYTPAIRVIRLAAPTNIRIDTSEASEGVISFDGPATGATSYTMTLNENTDQLPVNAGDNMNRYITTAGTAVHLISVGNHWENDDPETKIYYMTSESSATANFIKLEAPTFGTFAFSDTELIWNAPSNSNSSVYTPTYEVYDTVDGSRYNGEKNGTRFDISNSDLFAGGKSYSFQVKAIGNGSGYINSEKSSTVEIFKLATPEVSRVNGKYVWNSVPRASAYMVTVDGVTVFNETTSYSTYEYTPAQVFTEANKTYNVEVYAIGDSGLTTVKSSACKIAQQTKQLDTPEFKIEYVNPNGESSFDPNGEIKVTVTKAAPYASRYSFNVGNAEGRQDSNALVYYAKPRSAGITCTVNVYAVGGNFDEAGYYYVDSRVAANQQMRLLGAPNANDGSISTDKSRYLSWAIVEGALRYEIEYTTAEGTYKATANTNGLQMDTTKFKGDVTVKIRAVGNGTTIITGAWTTVELINQ